VAKGPEGEERLFLPLLAARGERARERQVRRSGRYPHLAKVLDAGIDPDAPETRDERFEFGLSCLLDGIAAQIHAVADPGGPYMIKP
jgi:hypothetical protein